jgi:hypothetical protein
MALAYTPPGVSIDEIVTPQISPLLAANALIALVGPAQGYRTRTDQFVLSGTSATPLPGLPVGAVIYDEDTGTGGVQATVTVKNVLNPGAGQPNGNGYLVTTDFTIDGANGTISRVGAGGITNNTLVNVTYKYVPADYYQPYRLYDLGSVESRYGSGLNAAGTAINSHLSYAAAVAFANGASSVICQPLFSRTIGGDATSAPVAPTTTSWATTAAWADTLWVLRDIEDINVIVPVVGQSMTNISDAVQLSIFQVFQDHCYFMQSQDQYIVAVFGEDSSTDVTKATKTTLASHATSGLAARYGGVLSEQTVLVNTSRFTRALPGLGATITVGGQYVAAAIAGLLDSRSTSSTLTRKSITGFTAVADPRDLSEKNTDASNGLLVVEQKGRDIFIRHAITLDTSASSRRELSVVRAKHRVIESVKQTIDTQLIGELIADNNATQIVEGTVIAVLEALRGQKVLVDYSGVQARLISLEPTTIQVRFSYRPSFPVNYINIEFSLDLSAGVIGVTGAETTL